MTNGTLSPSIENGIAGKYNFQIKKIYSEAWEKTKGFKGTFWGALACLIIIAFAAWFVAHDISNMIEGPINSAEVHGKLRPISEILKLIIGIFITTPLGAGLWMLIIKRSVNAPVNFKMLFQYFSYWKILWIFPIVTSVLTVIAVTTTDTFYIPFLMILALFFFNVTYFMFVPIAVDKKLGTWEAMEVSRKTIFHHWFKTLWFMTLMGLIAAASLLTLGIALIWTLPWAYCAMGILYRNMFGVQSISSDPK